MRPLPWRSCRSSWPSCPGGKLAALLTTGMLTLLLFVSLDLDRPTRGFIQIPTTALTSLQESMEDAPAAAGP